MLSPIRSARLSPHSGGDPDAMSATITNGTAYMGPFSVTDERQAYGASDTIAKNYRLHSAGLTMALMKHPEEHMDAVAAKEAAAASRESGTRQRGMTHSASAPLSLVPVSPAPRGLHKMNRGPKPPTHRMDAMQWDPSGPGQSFDQAKMAAVRARTVQTPHPYRMDIPGPLLIKGTDEWKVSDTTRVAIEKYWNVLTTSENDTREPSRQRVAGIAARSEMHAKPKLKHYFEMIMTEVQYEYSAANRRIALDYKLLSPRRGGTGINPQDLQAVPQWWSSAEVRTKISNHKTFDPTGKTCPHSWYVLTHFTLFLFLVSLPLVASIATDRSPPGRVPVGSACHAVLLLGH